MEELGEKLSHESLGIPWEQTSGLKSSVHTFMLVIK